MHYNLKFLQLQNTIGITDSKYCERAAHTQLSVLHFEQYAGTLKILRSRFFVSFPFSSLLSILSILFTLGTYFFLCVSCMHWMIRYLLFPFFIRKRVSNKSHLLGKSKMGWESMGKILIWNRRRMRSVGRQRVWKKQRENSQHIREHFEIIKRKLEQNFKLNMEIFCWIFTCRKVCENSLSKSIAFACTISNTILRLSRKFSRCILFFSLFLSLSLYSLCLPQLNC